MLTVEMFKERVPNSGDILFSALTNMLPHDQQLKRQSQQQLETPLVGGAKKSPTATESIKPGK